MGARHDLLRPAAEAAVVVARTDDSGTALPGPLRAILRFAHLPATAVATALRVLDEDPDFRDRVRTAVDPETVGEAAWLFLDRPEGWQEALEALESAERHAREDQARQQAESQAARRLEAVEAVLERTSTQLEEANGALVAVRHELGEERRARRLAETEAGRLRKRVEALDSEIDAGRGRVAGADAALAQAEALQARVAALEEALTAERSRREERPPAPDHEVLAVPQHPAVDAAAVAAAVGAATRAVTDLASALRAAAEQLAPWLPPQEPGLVPPGAPEAPAAPRGRTPRRRPAPLPPAVFDDTPEAAEHLLRLVDALVLVDGYNVTHEARADRPIGDQRRWLAGAAAGLAAATGAELVLVFDGIERSAPADLPRRAGVSIHFSPEGVDADDVILEMIPSVPLWRPLVVVSSDNRVRAGARRSGANVVSSAQLVALLPG